MIGLGKGGDMTGALDEAAEQACSPTSTRDDVRIVSEEIGIVRRAASYTVLVDPIDGSQNAERGSRTSRSRSRSPRATTIDDVVFGYVYDFGANEEWTAVRGGGAFLTAQPLTGRPKDRSSSSRSRRRRPRSCSNGCSGSHR